MKILLNHPTGNEFVRAAAKGLLDAEMLHEFHTALAVFPNTFLDRLSDMKPLADIRRRGYEPALQPYTHLWPWREVGRLVSGKLGLNHLVRHEKGVFSVDGVYQNLDKHIASRIKATAGSDIQGVYAYEDGAANSFREARKRKISCLYDLPIGYWRAARRLLGTELLTRPEWAATLTGFIDSDEKLAQKDEELRLADQIFVASSFTAKTLQDFPGKLAPVQVIPYGFPPIVKERSYGSPVNRPLKLLFVGGLSQRKGLANLFEAVETFGNRVELTVVGKKAVPDCEALNQALTRHRWIPTLSHPDILALMKTQDVLIFPSLFEGFGLVITEAMSQGTPVITTDRTAGPDLIQSGENGWLIQAGVTQALIEAIDQLLIHPERIQQVGKAARDAARLRPWQRYGQELATAIQTLNS